MSSLKTRLEIATAVGKSKDEVKTRSKELNADSDDEGGDGKEKVDKDEVKKYIGDDKDGDVGGGAKGEWTEQDGKIKPMKAGHKS
ncbi:hypothetical protein ACEPPN_006129 [Leptodophora sp. 'Broadleaf-Isolate-01']